MEIVNHAISSALISPALARAHQFRTWIPKELRKSGAIGRESVGEIRGSDI